MNVELQILKHLPRDAQPPGSFGCFLRFTTSSPTIQLGNPKLMPNYEYIS